MEEHPIFIHKEVTDWSEATYRTVQLYIHLLIGLYRLVKEGVLTPEQAEDMQREAREYATSLPQ
ncbi:hypothetical protein ACFP1I_22210 [Dyadobacter subterraneus]|uniref:Uncharacterized protein n=1 Tax=Dyadobacter subterraneus TaxID=2773304 RepID=A0ABR9WJ34_9BACT|nr:hypothetical protein [Dyadobacter subterraneus]MBE9465517.1 hypothetical protein [Dyadobacter subterraneus]